MNKFLSFTLLSVVAAPFWAQKVGSSDVSPVKCMTDNSIHVLRKNEERLDSIWRKEDIWNKGVTPINGTDTIKEPPRWAKWDYDLERYYVSRMEYPEELLKKNVAGYSVVMFSLDTLGLPCGINILTTIHKEFNKEVVRLTKELPHCLPCRGKNGNRMECFYTVYVPFLPQHYRNRVKADSIAEEELNQCFVEWEAVSYFQDRNPNAATNYIQERLSYNPELLGDKKQTKGLYTIRIDSYGEVTEAEIVRSCGIPEWDSQVIQIIKGMPRWVPTVNYHGKGEYRSSVWTVPVVFKNDSLTTSDKRCSSSYRLVIGYSTCDTPVLMRYGPSLIAHTTASHLEAGVPACYLNERGDTVVPYGKYLYCQADTIKKIGFVYENRPKEAKIVCIDNTGKELFYVFKFDNGPDYIREGLFRIMDENGLLGFADSLGNVVIKPQYTFAYPFKDGKAKVTSKGKRKEVPGANGKHHYWENGEWFYIDKRNIRLTD